MTPLERVKRAIEDIKQGKMVMMVDDEDRENEGDLVYASLFSTPEKVNFMASHAKGLICVAISKEIASRLELNPMVQKNSSCHETAFTVSVDAREASTGISAHERDMTIKLLVDYGSKASDLVRPGHIFPLIAKDGGTLVRTGHTEGSVDLCKLAGIVQSAVICEVMKEDGSMARRPDLDQFCQKHNINIVYISDIVEYRAINESLVRVICEANGQFLGHNTLRLDYVDHMQNHHIAYRFGDAQKDTHVKFHNIGSDFDLLSSQKRFSELINAIEYMAQNGGVLVFMGNEQVKDMQMREYGIGAQILRSMGVKKIKLISSSQIEFVGLNGFGLEVGDKISL